MVVSKVASKLVYVRVTWHLVHGASWLQVSVGPADVPGMPARLEIKTKFQYRDMDHFLREQFGNTKYNGVFVLKPKTTKVERDNKRVR